MTRIIGFANKKGGVGKTTSVVNIAAILSQKGYKTLVIDLDSQGNASLLLGINPYTNNKGVSFILEDSTNTTDFIKFTNYPNLFIIPSDNKINEIEMILRENKNISMLYEKMNYIIKDYDYILLDFPPSMSILTLNGFYFAKEVIIPVQTNYLSLDGVLQMTRLIYRLNAKFNPALKIYKILPTICDIRTKMHYEVLNELKKNFGDNLLLPIIHSDVKLAEMAKEKKPVIYFANNSQGARDYRNIVDIILKIY